jgi:hypothetical protein
LKTNAKNKAGCFCCILELVFVSFFLHKRVAYEKNIYHEMCAKYFVTMAARSVKNFGCTQRENFWQNEVVLKKYENIAIAATCENTFLHVRYLFSHGLFDFDMPGA